MSTHFTVSQRTYGMLRGLSGARWLCAGMKFGHELLLVEQQCPADWRGSFIKYKQVCPPFPLPPPFQALPLPKSPEISRAMESCAHARVATRKEHQWEGHDAK